MATAAEVNTSLGTNATGPKRVQVANESVEQHPLKDQIEAANHLAGQTAGAKARLGLRFVSQRPPGAWA